MVKFRLVIVRFVLFFITAFLLFLAPIFKYTDTQGCVSSTCPLPAPLMNDVILAVVLDSSVIPQSKSIDLSVIFGIINPQCGSTPIALPAVITYIVRLVALDFAIDPEKTQTYYATPSERPEMSWVIKPNSIGTSTLIVEVTALSGNCKLARKSMKLSITSTTNIGIDAKGLEFGNALLIVLGALTTLTGGVWAIIQYLGIKRLKIWFKSIKNSRRKKPASKKQNVEQKEKPNDLQTENR